MDKKKLLTAIKRLHISPEDYVVVGSGLLAALGLRDVDDIDLIVSEDVFENTEIGGGWKIKDFEDGTYYLTKGFYELGLDWDSPEAKPNLAKLKKDEVIIDGVPFVSPRRLITWKTKKSRQKDLEDIKLLERYLSK